jgi:uncharacterized protein
MSTQKIVEFDPKKDVENTAKDRPSFADFNGFDAEPVAIVDDRKDYGEVRIQLFGLIEGKAHCAVVTPRPNGLRLISFRRANEKECKRHGLKQN